MAERKLALVIVEDQPEHQVMLKESFHEHIVLECFERADRAFSYIQKNSNKIDVVLIDIDLNDGEKAGLELAKKLDKLNRVPHAIISSVIDQHKELHDLKLHFNHFRKSKAHEWKSTSLPQIERLTKFVEEVEYRLARQVYVMKDGTRLRQSEVLYIERANEISYFYLSNSSKPIQKKANSALIEIELAKFGLTKIRKGLFVNLKNVEDIITPRRSQTRYYFLCFSMDSFSSQKTLYTRKHGLGNKIAEIKVGINAGGKDIYEKWKRLTHRGGITHE